MNEPLKVTQEAVDVYEKRTGFYGIGRKMIEFGVWRVVSPDDLRKETACGKN